MSGIDKAFVELKSANPMPEPCLTTERQQTYTGACKLLTPEHMIWAVPIMIAGNNLHNLATDFDHEKRLELIPFSLTKDQTIDSLLRATRESPLLTHSPPNTNSHF